MSIDTCANQTGGYMSFEYHDSSTHSPLQLSHQYTEQENNEETKTFYRINLFEKNDTVEDNDN
jgi:hypothetical protein